MFVKALNRSLIGTAIGESTPFFIFTPRHGHYFYISIHKAHSMPHEAGNRPEMDFYFCSVPQSAQL